MKIHLALVGLIFIIFGCNENNVLTVINGKLIGSDLEDVYLYKPINDISYYWGFADTVKCNASGEFQIQLENKETVIIKIYSSKKACELIVEPGKEYNFTLDLTKEEDFISVTGPNSEGQHIYNALERPWSIEFDAEKYAKDTIANVVQEKIAQRKLVELSKYDSLYDMGGITEGFMDFVKKDIDCYYASITACVAFLKYAKTRYPKEHPEYEESFPEDFEQMWDDIFLEYPVDSDQYIASPAWYEYAQNYVHSYMDYKNKKPGDRDLYMKLRENNAYYSYRLGSAESYLMGKGLEFYRAQYIYYEAYQKQYEKGLITVYDQFAIDYPKSEYIAYLEPVIQPVRDFHLISEIDFPETVSFVENYENANSLAEILSSFKGKPVFIDVWATWCGPCIREFKYNPALKKFLKENDVEVLYISIDKDDYEEKWEQMIKYYDLKGAHIRANTQLSDDLKRVYRNGSLAIPWYLIIDSSGNIVVEHAKMPSSKEELYKQIKGVLNI